MTRLADLLDEQESVARLTGLLAAATERRDRTATAMVDAGELSSTDVAVMLGCTKANVSRITKRVRGLDWGPGTGDLRSTRADRLRAARDAHTCAVVAQEERCTDYAMGYREETKAFYGDASVAAYEGAESRVRWSGFYEGAALEEARAS